MCLAIPMKIDEIDGEWAVVREGPVKKRVNVSFTPKAAVGDYIIIHAGFAISIMSEKEAKGALEAYEELRKAFY